MWTLKHIEAKNLCAFKQVKYNIQQQRTTLIFGNNLDNDSQASNGSGKSALIEAIAIGLTGSPLRKVNVDEIINDLENEAVISVYLTNSVLGEQMTINHSELRKALSISSANKPGVRSVTSRKVGRIFLGKSVRPLRLVGNL